MTRTLLWVAGVIASIAMILAAGNGCGQEPDAYTVNGNETPYEACSSDADCSVPGEICAPHDVCLPRAAGGAALALELAPSETPDRLSRRLAPYEIPPLELSLVPDGETEVVYPEAVSLTGAVMVLNNAQVPLEARMTVSRASRIAGRPPVITTQTILAEGFLLSPRPEDVSPAFTLWVPRESPLTLRVSPVEPYDKSYRPIRSEVRLSSDAEQWFVFGDPEQSIYAAGTVLDAAGAPVKGVSVKAVDEETGVLESSRGVTDETGTYHLVLPRGLRSYRVELSPDSGEGPRPVFWAEHVEIGAMADAQGTENDYDNPEIVAPIRLPAYPHPVPVTLHLQGRSSDGSYVPVVGAQVTLETDLSSAQGVHGHFEVSGTSDESGLVRLELLPGDSLLARSYRVTVITPVDSGSEFASDVFDGERGVQVGLSGGVLSLELTRRVPVAASVFSEVLGEIAGLTVQARRIDGPDALQGTLRSVSTDSSGRFSLRLEPGRYRVEMLPPSGIPLPRWVLPDLWEVDEETVPVFPEGLVAPAPEVLELRVVSEADPGAPLPYVRVSLYQVDDFCATLNPVDIGLCDRAPAFLGDAVTDADGRVRFLVPASE